MSVMNGQPGNAVKKVVSAGASTGATSATTDFGFTPNAVSANVQVASGGGTSITGGELQCSYDGTTWINVNASPVTALGVQTYSTAASSNTLPVCRLWRYTYATIVGGSSPTLNVWLAATQ